jgi:hypothetical protein
MIGPDPRGLVRELRRPAAYPADDDLNALVGGEPLPSVGVAIRRPSVLAGTDGRPPRGCCRRSRELEEPIRFRLR